MMPAEARTWVVICIPGRDDADPGSWFAYDRRARQSVRADSREAAADICRHRNAQQAARGIMLATGGRTERTNPEPWRRT